MGFEVEQKFRAASHDELAARLAALGHLAGAPEEQVDTYFNHPGRDFATTGEAFRIRRHGARNAITYKGPRLAGPTKTRPEHEVMFAEGDAACATLEVILASLGFRAVARIRKHRTPYHIEHLGRPVEVVLDEVEELGSFVEVEALARDHADLGPAQAAVLDLAGRLGLTEIEPRSYLRMVLERRAGEGEATAPSART
ncbi:MAG: class IV adenylate cyclase [Isosphaeraceae bacterium]